MFESPNQIGKKGSPVVGAIVLAVVFVGGALGWILYRRAQPPSDAQPELSEEARAYLPHLALSRDTAMTAKEDALGQTLLEITGAITNNGERVCEVVEVNVVFREVNGLEIDRQRSTVVDRRTGPLAPGETQGFRMAFDTIPEAWNQVFPSLFISQIQFAGE